MTAGASFGSYGSASVLPSDPCPCGTKYLFAECCGELHAGLREAATAEELMRSRYSAFAVGDAGYLLRTWYPHTRPENLRLSHDVHWTALKVMDTVAGGPDDDTGSVEYRAFSRHISGSTDVLHELAQFQRRAGRWMYLDGAIQHA